MNQHTKRQIDFNRPSRMISGTKHSPAGHICVFNANICTRKAGKIWFGDIDLTTDADDLKRLAAEKDEMIFVLREMDARFMNEGAPLFDSAVATISPDGEILMRSAA